MPGMIGCTSTHAAASRSPCTCTLEGTAAATESRLVNTPRPPALQPAKSSRSGLPLAPKPCADTSAVTAALTMRAPRNEKLNVAADAPASPNQLSLLQYLMNIMLAAANGFSVGSVPNKPSCAKSWAPGRIAQQGGRGLGCAPNCTLVSGEGRARTDCQSSLLISNLSVW